MVKQVGDPQSGPSVDIGAGRWVFDAGAHSWVEYREYESGGAVSSGGGSGGINIVGSGGWADRPTDPKPNDGWVLEEPVAGAPNQPDGDPAAPGDVIVWTGVEWVNLGQAVGPAGPQGPAGPPGEQGADGADGPMGEVGMYVQPNQPDLSVPPTGETLWLDTDAPTPIAGMPPYFYVKQGAINLTTLWQPMGALDCGDLPAGVYESGFAVSWITDNIDDILVLRIRTNTQAWNVYAKVNSSVDYYQSFFYQYPVVWAGGLCAIQIEGKKEGSGAVEASFTDLWVRRVL